jgi:hypothetical protein
VARSGDKFSRGFLDVAGNTSPIDQDGSDDAAKCPGERLVVCSDDVR